VKTAAAQKMNPFKKAIKTLGDIFVPIIPAIVATGLLMGLLEGFSTLFPAMADSDTYQIFHMFSNTAFTFLPILIATSAAKAFGGNMFLGSVIGMIMIHPDLMNAWSVASAVEAGETIPKFSVWFGLYDINAVGYQGHVIPVIIAVWLMCFLEKRLHKIVPASIDPAGERRRDGVSGADRHRAGVLAVGNMGTRRRAVADCRSLWHWRILHGRSVLHHGGCRRTSYVYYY